MTEIFPPGYMALSDWISREANLRFGGHDIDNQQRWATFGAACQMFAAKEAAWGVIVADDGRHKPTPQSVWLSSSAVRRQMLETGRANFKVNWLETFEGRLGIWKRATLVPAARVREPTPAERIARQAENQRRAGFTLSSLPGSAPSFTSPGVSRAEPAPVVKAGSGPGDTERAEEPRNNIISGSDKAKLREKLNDYLRGRSNELGENPTQGQRPKFDELWADAKRAIEADIPRDVMRDALNEYPNLRRARGKSGI